MMLVLSLALVEEIVAGAAVAVEPKGS